MNEGNLSTQRVMPDFSHSFYGFRHTVDSALEILSTLEVPAERISLHLAGPGMPSRWVADQSPPPGAPLLEDSMITLSVAGLGFCHQLPVAMQDSGGEQEPGTKEVFELLDDPLQKVSHWVYEGARLFDIAPDNPEACARWLAVFGLNADSWPTEQLYPLALLLPSLQALAGKERGIRLALDLLLHLPVGKIRRYPSYRYMAQNELSLLGSDFNRVSVDYVLGNCLEDFSRSELVLGPVSLDAYYRFQEPAGKELLRQALRLVIPCHARYSIFWLVADPNKAPRLGVREENSVLGINSYLSPRVPAGQPETAMS
jgi:hypothetical protein